jgi:hypothetical protein
MRTAHLRDARQTDEVAHPAIDAINGAEPSVHSAIHVAAQPRHFAAWVAALGLPEAGRAWQSIDR